MGKIQVAGGQLKTPRWSERASSMDQPVVCHSPVLQSLRRKGKEGIRGEHGPPPGEGNSRASHREGLGWLPLNWPALAQPAALCAPKMPSTGGSCPIVQGHLLEGVALMLFGLTLSPQPAPHLTALGPPQGAGTQHFLSDGFLS